MLTPDQVRSEIVRLVDDMTKNQKLLNKLERIKDKDGLIVAQINNLTRTIEHSKFLIKNWLA